MLTCYLSILVIREVQRSAEPLLGCVDAPTPPPCFTFVLTPQGGVAGGVSGWTREVLSAGRSSGRGPLPLQRHVHVSAPAPSRSYYPLVRRYLNYRTSSTSASILTHPLQISDQSRGSKKGLPSSRYWDTIHRGSSEGRDTRGGVLWVRAPPAPTGLKSLL